MIYVTMKITQNRYRRSLSYAQSDVYVARIAWTLVHVIGTLSDSSVHRISSLASKHGANFRLRYVEKRATEQSFDVRSEQRRGEIHRFGTNGEAIPFSHCIQVQRALPVARGRYRIGKFPASRKRVYNNLNKLQNLFLEHSWRHLRN